MRKWAALTLPFLPFVRLHLLKPLAISDIFFLLNYNGYLVFDPKYVYCRDLFARNESVFLCFNGKVWIN